MHFMFSPFVVPVAGMLIAVVAIVSGIFSQAHARRLKAEQRMAMVARGMPAQDIVTLLGNSNDAGKDPMRSLGTARRAGIVLCSIAVGLMLFFTTLALILGERDIYSGVAIGLIPLAIGVGFFIDYHLQKRELSRFGLEIEPPRG